MAVLHLAPFDASRYPPLINTIRVCTQAGLASIVLAAAPIPNPQVFGAVKLVAPPQKLSGRAQQVFLAQALLTLDRSQIQTVIAHNLRGLAALALWPPLARARLVYHCHDFEFDHHADLSLAARALLLMERAMARRVDQIWVPAIERIQFARERHLPLPLVVKNCPTVVQDVVRSPRLRQFVAANSQDGSRSVRVVVRHGNIGPPHCILETVEALALLPADVVFVVVGDGERAYIERCLARAKELGVDSRLFFHPFVPHNELLSLIADADVASGLYAPLELNAQWPAPNKVFESMAVGVPVLVAAGNSVADDVTRAAAGLAVRLGSTERIAEALGRLLAGDAFSRSCAAAARRAHLSELNYETQLRQTLLGGRLAAL